MTTFSLDRSLIRVSGPEARPFLQGLVTQDVEKLAGQPLLYAGLLSPQGKLITDMILLAEGDDIVVDVAASRSEDLLRRLTMYRLRAKVELALLDATIAVDLDAPSAGASADPRRTDGALGWRHIAAKGAFAPNTEAWRTRRIELGIPDPAEDCAPEEVFALEALFEELNGVDFQKGCFVGQENVSRMKRRATTRRKFCTVAFDGEAPAFGAPVRAGEAELGTVRSGMPGRALALLRLDRAQEAIERGVPLRVGEQHIRLDPPSWLILPQGPAETGASG